MHVVVAHATPPSAVLSSASSLQNHSNTLDTNTRHASAHLGQGAVCKRSCQQNSGSSTAVFRPSRLLCALFVGDGRPAPMNGRPSPLSLKRLRTICPCSYRSSSRTTVKAGPTHCITQLYSFGNILTYCSNKYLTRRLHPHVALKRPGQTRRPAAAEASRPQSAVNLCLSSRSKPQVSASSKPTAAPQHIAREKRHDPKNHQPLDFSFSHRRQLRALVTYRSLVTFSLLLVRRLGSGIALWYSDQISYPQRVVAAQYQ